jgi:hypothetical protein
MLKGYFVHIAIQRVEQRQNMPYAYQKATQWCQQEREFVRRAGFVMMAELAVHDSSDRGPGSPSPLTRAVFSPNVYAGRGILAVFPIAVVFFAFLK